MFYTLVSYPGSSPFFCTMFYTYEYKHMHEQSINHKVSHCAGCILANTRPHQLYWGDQEMGTAISCTACVPIQHKLSRWSWMKLHYDWLLAKHISQKLALVLHQTVAYCHSIVHCSEVSVIPNYSWMSSLATGSLSIGNVLPVSFLTYQIWFLAFFFIAIHSCILLDVHM